MNYILQTNSLTKKYKNFQALNGLTMNVPKGSIYGFVGDVYKRQPYIASTKGSAFPPPGYKPHEGGSGTPPRPELRTLPGCAHRRASQQRGYTAHRPRSPRRLCRHRHRTVSVSYTHLL